MNDDQRELRFVQGLAKLHPDRGAMAALRRGIRVPNPRADGRIVSVLTPLMLEIGTGGQEERFYLVASLFAMVHTMTNPPAPIDPTVAMRDRPTIGDAFRELRWLEVQERRLDPNERTSVDARFIKLLDSDPEDLPDRLRHAVRLLASRHGEGRARITVDWVRLLRDLRPGYFNAPNRWVQQSWATSYWRAGAGRREETTESNVTVTE